MPALKLFVSHSSRLDDVAHKYTRDDHNWRLLEDTCHAIRQKYGDRVEVLVDKDGLVPGDDWNHQLNLWLAECHVAIILFSKRAIEKSDWVAKEATILSWRAELDESFTLIPVALAGETSPPDLARDFFGTLKIDARQCIPDARTEHDILAGIVRRLGEPEDLAGAYPQTPLEVLEGGIAALLTKATEASLCNALEAVGCPKPAAMPSSKRGYAHSLARHFLQTSPESVGTCFQTFKDALSRLVPAPARERARELFKYIRPLWVEPADVAGLRLAGQHRYPLALNGQLVSWSDPELRAICYTLERFIERAWPAPESDRFLPVPLTEPKPVGAVREEIRRRFLGGAPLPPGLNLGDKQDGAVNRDGRTIVLLIFAHQNKGGLPDPAFLKELLTLFRIYKNFMLVFDVGAERPALPASVKAAQPRLDEPGALQIFLNRELNAFSDERTTKTFLDQKYDR